MEINDSQDALGGLWTELFSGGLSDLDRGRKVLAELLESISGDRGHDKLLFACCELIRQGFCEQDIETLVHEYNDAKCSPSWSDSTITLTMDTYGHMFKNQGAGSRS